MLVTAIWSSIEEVITSTTGNRVYVKSVPRVRIPPTPPNKVDNFDTNGIETINLILFVKMLMAQGFSALVPF